MGFLSRKRGGADMEAPAAAPQASSIPDYGFNAPPPTAPKTTGRADITKTTSYPTGYSAFARFTGHERTTSYISPTQWGRRTYDTIN